MKGNIFKIDENRLKPLGPRDPRIHGVRRAGNVLTNYGNWSSGIMAYGSRM